MSGKMTRLFSVIILAIIFIALVLPLNTNVSRSENVTINYSFEKSQTSLYIVASMPSIAIIVKDIVGNTCTVDSILPEAIDPHSYQLTPSDVDKISQADLLVLANTEFLSIEASMVEHLKENALYIDYANYSENGVIIETLPGVGQNFHGYWTYPANALAIAKTVYQVLVVLDSLNVQVYTQNFQMFENRLKALNDAIQRTINDYNLNNTGVVVAVPGAAYFAKMLQLSIKAMLVTGPNRFANATEIAAIEEDISQGEIEYILCPYIMRDTKPGQIAEQISQETGIPVLYPRIFATHGFDSYVDFISFNLGTIEGQLIKEESINQPTNGVSDVILFSTIAVLGLIAIFEGYLLFIYKKRLEEEA